MHGNGSVYEPATGVIRVNRSMGKLNCLLQFWRAHNTVCRYTALQQNIYKSVSKYAKQFKKEYHLPLVPGLITKNMSLASQKTCNFPASFLFTLWDITRHVQKYDIYSISLQTGTAEPRLLKRCWRESITAKFLNEIRILTPNFNYRSTFKFSDWRVTYSSDF